MRRDQVGSRISQCHKYFRKRQTLFADRLASRRRGQPLTYVLRTSATPGPRTRQRRSTMVTYVIGWLFTGVVVGALARTLMPGRQTMGLGATMLLGIVGALVGGFLSWALFGPAAS